MAAAVTPRQTSVPSSPRRYQGAAPAALHYLIAQHAGAAATLVVVPDEQAAIAAARDLTALGGHDVAVLFGAEHTPFETVATHARDALAKLALRHRLMAGTAPRVLVACAAALQGCWSPVADFARAQRTLRCNEDIDRDALLAHLLACGYQRVNQVEDEGTFAVRGGTIDVFVPEAKQPVRLDLFGDTLTDIRPFAAESQALGAPMAHLTLFPIRDVVFTSTGIARAVAWLQDAKENVATPSHKIRALCRAIELRQYFFGIEALWPIFYDGHQRVWDALRACYAQVVVTDSEACRALWQQRSQRAERERARAIEAAGPQVAAQTHVIAGDALAATVLEAATLVHAPVWLDKGPPVPRPPLENFVGLAQALAERRKNPAVDGPLTPLLSWLRDVAPGYRAVWFCCNNHGNAMRLHEMLRARRFDVPLLPGPLPGPGPGPWPAVATTQKLQAASTHFGIYVAPLSGSVDDAANGVALLSDAELFGAAPPTHGRARKQRLAKGDALATLRSLQAGDLIIHQDHGIGRYQGLVRLVLDGVDGDFVHLAYADGDKLYVPVFRLGLLKRYHGSSAHAQLDKLGGVRWERAKRRVRDTVLAMAHTLLALQAQRKAQRGFALPAPNEAYAAFAASFPFEETPDQSKAIAATLADLQRDAPMDRLVCGDVGFGKTEVALRAAFLALEAGRQVAVLVPTTVLAEQHKQTFAARLAPFAGVVDSLSRFRSPKEAKDVVAKLKAGQIDVLIGTHRLLSADVAFANLGLLIVDEEQRFGVKHKERIKQLRNQVHVLTLSATPIPRTLHMATAGMRDLSLIQTPPLERSAIRTHVLRYDEDVLQEAIRRELHRGGQVFVVHNRIEGMQEVHATLKRLVPEAIVVVGHGQMAAPDLESVMVQFARRKAHVLLCTAIIESGIDMPSVNTMVVLRADAFGLSQLYQLRGRIGRGRERAFAYLMLPGDAQLNKEANERLRLLQRFSELGSGFHVASHDLELRGAGDLLGANQSGHIASVGFELYTQLLHEAVEQARGQKPRQDVEPDIKIAVSAVFPERYMPEPFDRLAFYQRMAEASSDEQIYAVIGEVQQLFGPPPPEAEALVALMSLRRRLRMLGVAAIAAAHDAKDSARIKVGLTFVPDAAIDRAHLVTLCQEAGAAFRLLPSGRLSVSAAGPPWQPADPARDRDVPYVLGKDMLGAVHEALAPLRMRAGAVG